MTTMLAVSIVTVVALAAVLLLVSAWQFWQGRLVPDVWQSLGLAFMAVALGISLLPAPEPIPPGPATGDYGGIRPHIQGEGSTTPGGRGGQVCRVKSLSSGGGAFNDGTFAGCLALPPGCTARTGTQASCAVHVLFDVSGAVDFGNRTLIVRNPFVSIWGGTAPTCSEGTGTLGCESGAGGFTLQRAQLNIDTHDVYVGHLRLRRGAPSLNPLLTCNFNSGYDCTPVHSHVFDHLSIAWADMPPDGSSGVNNLNGAQASNSASVMVDSIMSEPLWSPAWGGINAAFCGVFARNLLAHGFDRNPIWSGGRCAVFNNVIYNGSEDLAGQALITATSLYDPTRLGRVESVFRDNVYLKGPSSGGVNWTLGLYIEAGMLTYGGGAQVYMAGNSGPGIEGSDMDANWRATQLKQYDTRPNAATAGVNSNVRTNTLPTWFAERKFAVTANAGTAIADLVLPNAGARPRDRDSADRRIAADVEEGDGTSYLDWPAVESRYGGQPVIVERQRVCQPPSNPHGPGSRTLADGTKNTRIEDWLEGITDYDGTPGCGARRLEVRFDAR